jgi:hypothetical protein
MFGTATSFPFSFFTPERPQPLPEHYAPPPRLDFDGGLGAPLQLFSFSLRLQLVFFIVFHLLLARIVLKKSLANFFNESSFHLPCPKVSDILLSAAPSLPGWSEPLARARPCRCRTSPSRSLFLAGNPPESPPRTSTLRRGLDSLSQFQSSSS